MCLHLSDMLRLRKLPTCISSGRAFGCNVRMNKNCEPSLIPGNTSNGCESYCRLCILSISVSKELLNFNLSGNLPCWLWQWKEKGGFRTVSEIEIVDPTSPAWPPPSISRTISFVLMLQDVTVVIPQRLDAARINGAKYRLRRTQTRKVTYIKEGNCR